MARRFAGWKAALATVALMAGVATASTTTQGPAAIATEDEAAAWIAKQAADRRLLLLGEFHGTREIPRLVTRLVQHYAAGGPVLLGLEIDHREQGALDAYLRSDGGAAARTALGARAWWTRTDDQHDGRRSHDMLDLIEAVRRLRAGGADVALLAYDVNVDPPHADRDARDRAMATSIRVAHDALPRGRALVLTGNVHAMKARPSWLPAEAARPAGTWLGDLQPFSVRLMAREGTSWGCRAGTCGPRPADGRGARSQRTSGPYDAVVVLPRFTVARLVGAAVTH